MNHTNRVDDCLIDMVYAAVLGEATWADFLAELSKALPGGRTTLFYHDASERKGAWELSYGFDETTLSDYANYYCRINPWMAKAAIRQIGLGVVAEQMLPAADFRKTEFYSDFYRRMGVHSAVGVTIVRERGRSFLLSTLTSRADPDENRIAADRLTILAPHLRRAFKHFSRDHTSKQISEIGAPLLDAIDIGMIVVGEYAVVKFTSGSVQSLIEQGSCVRLTRLGRAKICCPETDRLLQAMLNRTYDGSGVASAIVGSVKLTLIRVNKDRFSAYFEGPTVLLLLEPIASGRRRPTNIKHLALTYGLTAAETRALASLADGKRASEIAETAMLSRETIRTQIKSLYAKMGVASQLDLLRIVGS
ncbi:helix-turn-helix transcriptional regulator [Mesorhizobium sp. CN2-181]|uniref:helix-turn-helix transcriptional regulator n=1 Tax=Mesorhizobium yinganensis TaxID=3157707 RepID=UPI0032B76FE1